jgi:lipid-A-disaccharide synthase
MAGGPVFFIAGERSGDCHGADLVRELTRLRPGFTASGLGGPAMAEASGGRIEDWVEEAGVVGLWEVLKKYGYFRRRFEGALGAIARLRPAAVVFIDYPGFNLRLAKALARRRDPAARVYFISPQVWAWNRRRIPGMARALDLMLCIFPFEPALYGASGLRAEFVGHPLVDQLGAAPAAARQDSLVGLFPGSRAREVEKHFPLMLEAARELQRDRGGLRFVASAASDQLAGEMRALRDTAGWGERDLPVETGNAKDLMRSAAVGAVASGTATLEAACCSMPYCLVYRVAWPTYLVGKMLVEVDYLGIVNILAGRGVVREFVQGDATPHAVASELAALLTPGGRRDEVLRGMGEAVGMLGSGGTAANAARQISALLDRRDQTNAT